MIREAFGAQYFFRFKRSKPLILQINRNIERKLEIACRAPGCLRRLSFCAVHPKRQTNDQCLSVKAFERIRYLAQELFPIGPAQRSQRAHSDAKLVGDGHADALLTQIEREQASGELLASVQTKGLFMGLYFWQCSFLQVRGV